MQKGYALKYVWSWALFWTMLGSLHAAIFVYTCDTSISIVSTNVSGLSVHNLNPPTM